MIDPTQAHGTATWFSNFGQISVSTLDLAACVRFWEETLGIGPWLIYRGLTMDAIHEGALIKTPFDVALTWHDGRVVELIQATGPGPSPLHDSLNRAVPGLNRLASLSRDIERDAQLAESRGMVRMTYGDSGGQRFIHYRSDEAPGLILELLELTPKFEQLMKELQERAASFAAARSATNVSAGKAQAPRSAPSSMTAALLADYGSSDRFYLADVPLPEPGDSEVRIRMVAAAVNPADVKARLGRMRDWSELEFPVQLGGDVSGVVDAVGARVTKFAPGDRVIGMINPFANGAYAEYVIADEASLVNVPAALDLVDAAALPTGVLTGTQLVEIGIAPKPGDRVLVTGAGGSTGRAAVIALLEAGASPIAGVRRSAFDSVSDLPVETVVDLEDADAIAALGTIDAIADTVAGETLKRLYSIVKPDGTVASIVMPPPVPPANNTQRQCSLIVRFDANRLSRFMHMMIQTGRTMPIAHRLPLEQIAVAHGLVERGGLTGKVIVTAPGTMSDPSATESAGYGG